MLNDLKNIFIKNFTGLKAVFAVMTAYLLYDEISLFVSKPTLTSISRAHLGPEHFPEIRVCPVPSFLQTELQSQGDRARLCSHCIGRELHCDEIFIIVMLRQLSYVIKNQLKAPKGTFGIFFFCWFF